MRRLGNGTTAAALVSMPSRHLRRTPVLVRSIATALSFVVLWMSIYPSQVRADDVSVSEHVKRFARDGVYLAAAPLRLSVGDLLPIAVVGGAIGATIGYDGQLHDRMAELRHWGGANDLTTA